MQSIEKDRYYYFLSSDEQLEHRCIVQKHAPFSHTIGGKLLLNKQDSPYLSSDPKNYHYFYRAFRKNVEHALTYDRSASSMYKVELYTKNVKNDKETKLISVDVQINGDSGERVYYVQPYEHGSVMIFVEDEKYVTGMYAAVSTQYIIESLFSQ